MLQRNWAGEGVVWQGIEKGKRKEGRAILVSTRALARVESSFHLSRHTYLGFIAKVVLNCRDHLDMFIGEADLSG